MGFNTKGSDNRVHEKRKKHKKDQKIKKKTEIKAKTVDSFIAFNTSFTSL